MQGRFGPVLAELAGYIIDDIVKAAGWLVTDQAFCLFQAGDTPAHVLKPFAIGFGVGDVSDLAFAVGEFDRLLGKIVYRDLEIAAEVKDLTKTV